LQCGIQAVKIIETFIAGPIDKKGGAAIYTTFYATFEITDDFPK
jgi:hypothetical protein